MVFDSAKAETSVSGIISGNEIWTKAGSPYIVVGGLQVGGSLVIEAGVTVETEDTRRFGNQGSTIEVFGTLVAEGASTDPISFYRIHIVSSDAQADTTLRYAFLSESSIEMTNLDARFSLTDSYLRGSGGRRKYFGWNSTIKRNIFYLAGVEVNNSGALSGQIFNIENNHFYNGFSVLPVITLDTEKGASLSNNSFSRLSYLNDSGTALQINSGSARAVSNYWGTQDPEIISGMIFDREDSLSMGGPVEFIPFLTDHHPLTPQWNDDGDDSVSIDELSMFSLNGNDQNNQNPVTGNSFLGRAYHMTSSTSPNLSAVHIINSSNSALSFTGTLYHKSGSQLGDSDVALHSGLIEPQGRLILFSRELEQLFNELPWTGPAILDVRSSNRFELMSKLSRNGRVTNTNCVRTGNVHNLEGDDSPDVSYIRFINDGFTTLPNIRGTLYDANGDPIGQSNVQLFETLGPRVAIFLNRFSISKIVGETWTGEASLVLSETYENLQLMNLNFVNDETFFNFSCYESSS